jgi:hypothetical protein
VGFLAAAQNDLQGNTKRAALFDAERLRLARTLRAPWLITCRQVR